MNNIVLAGTGHRPDKLGGYDDHTADRLYLLALAELRRIKPSVVISGMALGWDQALALAALDSQVPVHAYVPFRGQESKWPVRSRSMYASILARVAKRVVVCEGDYAAWKMNRRNEAMVNDCEGVLALWNGSPGGTANCVFYAKKMSKPVHNCWAKWLSPAKQQEITLEAARNKRNEASTGSNS